MLFLNGQTGVKMEERVQKLWAEMGDLEEALMLKVSFGNLLKTVTVTVLPREMAVESLKGAAVKGLHFERAHRLEPAHTHYFSSYVAQADPARVRPEIDRALDEAESQPLSLIVSSIGAVGSSVESCTVADYRRFAEILERVLGRSTEADSSLDARFRRHGYLFLGLNRESLGETHAAAEAYTRGLAIDPDNALLLAARGGLRYGSRPGEVGDLERAVRVGVDYIWPYYFLAHHRFREGRFRECLQFAADALKFDGPDSTRSELSEWIAIARAELRFPPDMVREAFEEAVRLDPSNERARRNREVYEARLASPPSDDPRPFEARSARELRASVPPGIWFKGAA